MQRLGLKHQTLGFSLVEMMVAIGVLSAVSSVSIWSFTSVRQHQALADSSRVLLANLRRARAAGVTGAEQAVASPFNPQLASDPPIMQDRGSEQQDSFPIDGASPPPQQMPIANTITQRVRFGGVVIRNERQYDVFGDVDATFGNGNEVVLETVDLATQYPNANLQITNPAPNSVLRFYANGTRDLNTPDQIQIANVDTGQITILDINGGGAVRIR